MFLNPRLRLAAQRKSNHEVQQSRSLGHYKALQENTSLENLYHIFGGILSCMFWQFSQRWPDWKSSLVQVSNNNTPDADMDALPLLGHMLEPQRSLTLWQLPSPFAFLWWVHRDLLCVWSQTHLTRQPPGNTAIINWRKHWKLRVATVTQSLWHWGLPAWKYDPWGTKCILKLAIVKLLRHAADARAANVWEGLVHPLHAVCWQICAVTGTIHCVVIFTMRMRLLWRVCTSSAMA